MRSIHHKDAVLSIHASNEHGHHLHLKEVTISVLLASAALGGFVNEAYAATNTNNDNWPADKTALNNGGVEVSNSTNNDSYYYNRWTDSDALDGARGWIWGNGPSSSVLNVTVTKTQAWQDSFGDNPVRTIWIAGGVKSVFGGSAEDMAKATEPGSGIAYSSTTNDNVLNFSLSKGATFLAKLFGARNDLGGGVGDTTYDTNAGKANGNILNITLSENSKLYLKIGYGARSPQLDKVSGPIHAGFETDRNKVIVKGTLIDANGNPLLAKDVTTSNYGSSSLLILKGLFGAEGYQTNNNLVSISDSILMSGAVKKDKNGIEVASLTRKLGIVGGRGTYYLRINEETLPGVASKNNCMVVGKEFASYANSNIVTIDNSFIGLEGKSNWVDWTQKSFDGAITIYGGWAIGQAKNNIVSIKDSVVNGNVIGALELNGQIKATGTGNLRPLDANLVSLYNTKIEKGYSVFGTSTANADGQIESGVTRVDENSLQAVNRRRGIVYLTGENTADSVYARYVHFGQYVDNSVLNENPNTEREIVRAYYPTSPNYESIKNDPDYTVKDSAALKRITSNSGDSAAQMRLGDLVAGSYILNRTGFHSSLTSNDPDNVSDVTNGLHNFWVGAYVNLVKGVNGDGKLLNKNTDLFTPDKLTVNHTYGNGTSASGQNLSLLVHDDGMVYTYDPNAGSGEILGGDGNSKHRPALMHNFRYHYDGLVLYIGVNSGKDGSNNIQAVQISFEQIEKFRKTNEPDLDAFGNTFVGVFLEGNPHPFFLPSISEGFDSVKASEMTFEPNIGNNHPFEITQNGDHVANATYAFYKYMHFDGKDGEFNDKMQDGTTVKYSGKVTPLGESGGVGLKYWLKSLDIIDGKILVLNGITDASELGDGTKEITTSIRPQERFTLSASLEGSGNVEIAEGSTVVVGTPKTIYNIASVDADGNPVYSTPAPNTYTGATTVAPGAVLIAGIDGALGNTRSVTLTDGQADKPTSLYLQKHTQTIGSLTTEENSLLALSDNPAEAANLQALLKDTNINYEPDEGTTGGELTVTNGANIEGKLSGINTSKLIIHGNQGVIKSENPDFLGEFVLNNAAVGKLENANALMNGTARIESGSTLYFNTKPTATRAAAGNPAIGSIINSGNIFLSNKDFGHDVNSLNDVQISGNYEGHAGSVIHYRGLVRGNEDSHVDVVHAENASGTSAITFFPGGDSGIFADSRGEKVGFDKGILVFAVKNATADQKLTMDPFGVKAEEEGYEWVYRLAHRDGEDGANSRNWYLVNSDGDYQPIFPPDDLPTEEVIRSEAGAYVANSQAWSRMHMRLHDRMGQAYYIDPFDGQEKPAAAWVRQVGSHSHFKMESGASKTHARTAITQFGGDLIRDQFNEDWKYIGGIFAGGLYNRATTRTWRTSDSRSDGYSLGIYGTLYTGNSPDDGFYVDSWLLFGRYDNKVWSKSQYNSFKYKSHGWVWSIESGYTIPLAQSGTKDFNKLIWTFQPEVQFVFDGVRANSVTDETNTKYKQLGKDNVSIRAGARLHANYMNKGLGFIEGNWIHNTKKAGVEMGHTRLYQDGGRNLGEFRMGLEGHWSRNLLGWATVGVKAGKGGYHEETAQIGIKYMF